MAVYFSFIWPTLMNVLIIRVHLFGIHPAVSSGFVSPKGFPSFSSTRRSIWKMIPSLQQYPFHTPQSATMFCDIFRFFAASPPVSIQTQPITHHWQGKVTHNCIYFKALISLPSSTISKLSVFSLGKKQMGQCQSSNHHAMEECHPWHRNERTEFSYHNTSDIIVAGAELLAHGDH